MVRPTGRTRGEVEDPNPVRRVRREQDREQKEEEPRDENRRRHNLRGGAVDPNEDEDMDELIRRNDENIREIQNDIDANGDMRPVDHPRPESPGTPTLADLVPTRDMDGDGDVTMEAARAAGGDNPQSKETPISRATPSYGLQETHTTVIPFNFWFTSTGMDKTTANVMEIRMNSPVDIIATPLLTLNSGDAWQKGLYNVPFNNASNAGAGTYPKVIATGGNMTERPFWWEYWRKLYDYYTVLGCEYHITIRNPSGPGGNEVLLGTQFDTYSGSSTGNTWPRSTILAEAFAHKQIQWKIINSETTGESMKNDGAAVIHGTYKPGQNKRNIINDGDVKTWTKTNDPTDPAQTSLRESLTLMFWRAPLAYSTNTNIVGPPASITTRCGVNVEVKLKYLVQFKDLKEAARYPYTTNAVSITQTLPTDVMDSIGA